MDPGPGWLLLLAPIMGLMSSTLVAAQAYLSTPVRQAPDGSILLVEWKRSKQLRNKYSQAHEVHEVSRPPADRL